MMAKKDNMMIRTQIQLKESQYQRLKGLAKKRGVSMAQLVREGVDAVLASRSATDGWEDLFSVVGKYGGESPSECVGRNHDAHLEEAYGDWRRSS